MPNSLSAAKPGSQGRRLSRPASSRVTQRTSVPPATAHSQRPARKKKCGVLQISRALAAVGFLALSNPALAESPDDDVPGHRGVAYAMLLKQIAPDLTKDENGIWTLTGIKNFRGVASSHDPLAEEVSFSGLTVL